MKSIIVPYQRTSDDLLPLYQSEGSSGADLPADIPVGEEVVIRPGERKSISTGLRFQIPAGYEAQLRPRSGLALREGITLLNTPGTVDCDYRGEVRVILVNLGSQDFHVKRGDRIAQIVFTPVVRAGFRKSGDITATKRGEGGFGSTGT
jgi:dUTP pyrophosphatase